jgi:hypothetical protein
MCHAPCARLHPNLPSFWPSPQPSKIAISPPFPEQSVVEGFGGRVITPLRVPHRPVGRIGSESRRGVALGGSRLDALHETVEEHQLGADGLWLWSVAHLRVCGGRRGLAGKRPSAEMGRSILLDPAGELGR